MRRIFITTIISIVVLYASLSLSGEVVNVDADGLIIHGYDPVSYHQDTPTKGKNQIALEVNGGIYLFSSQQNRDLFKADPQKYSPAYGGYCAWAMLNGEKVDVDPETYTKIDGQVLLFYNSFFVNTLDKWNDLAARDTETVLKERADKKWQEIHSAGN